MKVLLPLLMFCAVGAPAQTENIGCTPVSAEPVSAEQFDLALKPKMSGSGATVAALDGNPGVKWDLGENRTASLSVYLTRMCALGLKVSAVSAGETSSPDINSAVQDLTLMLSKDAPDWTLSTEPPNTIIVRKGETTHSTDLRQLLKARLDAGTAIKVGGASLRAIYAGWLLFLVPENTEASVNLSVRSTIYPWAYYDLTPYGLPKLVAKFSDDKAELWALP